MTNQSRAAGSKLMDDATSILDAQAHAARIQRDGYTIIKDFLDPGTIAEVRSALAPHLGAHQGRNNFEGYQTERVYTLVARGPVFERIVEDPRVLALCDRALLPGYLLTASQAICIYPGETPQPIHSDDSFYTIPRPRPALSFSTIVAVDPFTADNGGTEIIPGSHTWSDAEVASAYFGRDDDLVQPPPLLARLQPVDMPPGACLAFLGTLLHRGGPNRSPAPRLAFSNQYCQPWARTQENFFLGIPPELVRLMSPRLQQLLGYDIWPPFMGHVTASHPLKALAPDFVPPVLTGKLQPK
jgi:ectoine hydroxylase-related dioxygenase (phytanoyl-CoA dioxygenase family)